MAHKARIPHENRQLETAQAPFSDGGYELVRGVTDNVPASVAEAMAQQARSHDFCELVQEFG